MPAELDGDFAAPRRLDRDFLDHHRLIQLPEHHCFCFSLASRGVYIGHSAKMSRFHEENRMLVRDKLFIGGRWVAPSGREMIDGTTPAPAR